jgi:type IV pilus assembly protein PilM
VEIAPSPPLRKLKPNLSLSSKPRIACEIAADRVLAGRVSDAAPTVEACSSQELSPGVVVPDMMEANLKQRDALSRALRSSLESVGGRSRDVIAILPDASSRVAWLDFDTLPSGREEAEGVVRFRLKKSLPFNIDEAKVSYHAHTANGGVRVVAAVALTSVIQEYESLFRELGYSPGVVLPSMLAALGAVNADRPTLVVKVDANTTGVAILDQQQLLLIRTLENPRGVAITGEQLAEDIYPSVVFFEDTYHLNIQQIFVAGLPETGGAAPALRAQTGAEVQELVASSQLSGSLGTVPKWRMAGVVGALLG